MPIETCKGTCRNGASCRFKGRYEGYCKHHLIATVECPICYEGTKEPVGLPCGHKYHADCIRSWLQTGNSTCPMCRSTVPESVIRKMGVVIDIRLEVIRYAESYLLNIVNDDIPLILRYKQCSILIRRQLNIEEQLRCSVIMFMTKRMRNRMGAKHIEQVRNEISIIQDLEAHVRTTMPSNMHEVSNEIAGFVQEIIRRLICMEHWVPIVA